MAGTEEGFTGIEGVDADNVVQNERRERFKKKKRDEEKY